MIDTAEWVGTTLCDGRYRVLRKLGEGGMAHVYLAHDDKLEREVVIKVARSNLVHDSGFTGRFTREVRSLAKLGHPHIVPLIDIGQHDGAPFAVMQFLTGGSLRDRQPHDSGQGVPVPVDTLHAWLPAIAQALDFVHKNKFIHRDVKPENILFDADGQPFLADLGIIKALSEPEDPSKRTVFTGAGMVLGTPQYMAPELILGEEVDGRVDQYALAVTVYEMLAGKVPFTGTSAPAIFIQQTTKPPTPLREIVPNLPEPLVEAVDRALAKSPKERFATCVDFVQAALGLTASTPGIAKTIMEQQRVVQDPILATVLEPRPGSPTPSIMHQSTRVEPVVARLASPPNKRLWGGIAAAVLVVAVGLLAFLFVPRGSGNIKIAEVQPLSLTPGDRQPIRVEIERQRIDGEVACWLDGLPEGVKANKVNVPGDQTKAIIDLTVASNAAPGKTKVTLKAKCQSAEASVPVEIDVIAPAASVRFLPIAPCTIKAGEIATVMLSVERKSIEGPIKLKLEGLPSGVTWNRPFFNAPEIPANQSTYPLELKATSEVQNEQATVKVIGKLDTLDAAAGLSLTVFAAPKVTTPEPGGNDVAKDKTKKDKTSEPIDTSKIGKDKEKEKDNVPPPVAKAELILSPIVGFTLRAGQRRTVYVQIQRFNSMEPVDVAITGLPTPGVTLEPYPAPQISPRHVSTSFDIVVAPTATETKRYVTITATMGGLRKSTSFNFAVEPAPVVASEEVLWQKSDRLDAGDPFDRVRVNSPKSFSVFLKANQTYVIDMTSDTFDSFLRVETKNGEQLASDDNGGGGLNSRCVVTPRESGIHYLIATSTGAGSIGAFTLKIRSAAGK